MKKTVNYLAVISCFALAPALAHAEPTGHGSHMYDEMHSGAMHGQLEEEHFKEMDTNGDGMVSKAEFDAAHDKFFKEMDANGDGQLSPEEMKAGRGKVIKDGIGKRFDEADKNLDGALTRREAKRMPMLSRHFDEVDANHDRKITREEFDAAMEKMRENHEGKQSSGW